MKKFFYSLTVLFALLPFAISAKTITADDVTLDGDNIPGLSFNDSTNTLTFDNYDGGLITISDFEADSLININLKGENTITGDGYSYADGISINTDDVVNVKINGSEGSSLTINDTYNGIYAVYANIEVNDANLIFNDTRYCIMYIYTVGGFNINNSIINATNVVYGIDTYGGDINIKDSKITFTDSNDYFLFTYGALNMDNSTFDVINGDGYYSAYVYNAEGKVSTIKDSKMNIDGMYYGFYSYNPFNFINSEVTITNTYEGFYFTDEYNNINISFDNTKVNIVDANYGFGIYGSLEFKNKSTVHIIDATTGFYIEDYYTNNNTFDITDSTFIIEKLDTSDTSTKEGMYLYVPLTVTNSRIDMNNLDTGILNYQDDLVFKDSEVNMVSNILRSIGITSEEHNVILDDTKFYGNTKSAPIIVVSEEDPDAKIEIKGKSYFDDKDIKPLVYDLDKYYTILGKEIDPSILSIEDLYDNAGIEVAILLPEEPKPKPTPTPKPKPKEDPKEEKKEDVPETVDNIIFYTIMGSLSVGILSTIMIKKHKKELV